MKKTIMIVIISLAMGLFLFSSPPPQTDKPMVDARSLIIGQWINEGNDLLEFTANKQIFLNGQKYGQFRFMVDADSIIIVELNNRTAKNNRKYFKMKIENKTQWVLIDITMENRFEKKTFIRLNQVQKPTDK
jgi:hypothetical protein